MNQIIFHIDVNSAFLSWTAVEQLKEGAQVDLRTVPSIIGGDQESRHGVVLAKSEMAKKFGIEKGDNLANLIGITTREGNIPAFTISNVDFGITERARQFR